MGESAVKKRISVVGGAAIGDYIVHGDHRPEKGEIVLIDQEPRPLVAGGCAPNIAAGIAALGQLTPVLCYPVGDDPDTAVMRRKWEQRGIECRLSEVHGKDSGRSWMFMQSDGTTMCFGYPGAADLAEPDTSSLEDWVVVAPVLNRFTTAYLEAAIAAGLHVAVTGIGAPPLLDYLRNIDVLIINRCECAALCAAGNYLDAVALSAAYPELLLYVTSGSKGSVLYRCGGETPIPTVTADRLTDFTGAGDSYTSGLLSALLSGYDPVDAGWIGAANASFVVEQFGGQDISFPTWDMIFQRLEDQFGHRARRDI